MNSSQQSSLDDVSLTTNEYEYLNRLNVQEADFNTQQQNVNNINSEGSIYTIWARIFGLLIVASLIFVIALYYGIINP